MKNYPKNLADVIVLGDAVQYLYEQAENAERTADGYREDLKSEEADRDDWRWGHVYELEAKAEAYKRLAEKLTK